VTGALLLAALCAAPAAAQEAGIVRRGPIDQVVRVVGTVLPVDIFRIKSTIEGRASRVWTSTGVWVSQDQDLGFLINKEFAALSDARKSTSQEVLEDRWQTVYQPTRLRCPYPCYILKAFARSDVWVKPRTVLFEAAAHLRMSGWVRPEAAHLVRDGMTLQYWAVKDPGKRFTAKISKYVRDVQGLKVQPGGSFNLDLVMGPEHFFPPGTEWAGIVVPSRKANALTVPTDALIRFGDHVYLPVKVSTGITTPELTEITAGVEEKRPILMLADPALREAARHKLEADLSLPPTSAEERASPAAEPARRTRRQEGALREPDSILGEDPYSE
jgi:multidrug efflux pump subunit AcrA (membrane-fusion protein)